MSQHVLTESVEILPVNKLRSPTPIKWENSNETSNRKQLN